MRAEEGNQMTEHKGIGASVPRVEDRRFLTGASQFSDDLTRDGQLTAIVVRSPHPHATIRAIDTGAARAMAGVRAVYAAADLRDVIKHPIPSLTTEPPFDVRGRDGEPATDASQYPLATDRVRYLGEPVAFVVADTLEQARDAAQAVEVDYDELSAAVTIEQALAAEAPLWDAAPDNVSLDWAGGDAAAAKQAFEQAAHVTSMTLVNNRVVIAFMEPRACLAEPDGDDHVTMHVGCQGAHGMRAGLAAMFDMPMENLRVVVPDTGGGFGARGGVYPEFALTLAAARLLGRPVKWTADRAESFLADNQSRDHVMRAELALDADGNFLAVRANIDWRHGAYIPSRNIWVIINFLPPTIGGVYRIPAADISIRSLFTNTTPQAAYRGIGRVETNYLIESLIDQAARETGHDRIELRRRNLVTPAEMPWTAPGGAVYHSGQFTANLARALDLGEWDHFAARREASEEKGLKRGIGVSLFIENDGGAPGEFAEVVAEDDGTITLLAGTQDFGMGHATMYAQILSDELGVPFEAIKVAYGDTDRVARGSGSHGSRSARIGGAAVVFGARDMVKLGTELAAELLEAAAADIAYTGGSFTIQGTDRAATLAEVASFAAGQGKRLAAQHDFLTEREAHSNGCHVAEVEIDPATGQVRLDRYSIVADVGRVVNPMIVDGQMHGGAAQGIGQALLEDVVYDPGSGQTLSGSFMDYTMPRADDLPDFAIATNEVIETDNPVGVKGAGENATSGAPAAIMNAIRDALNGAEIQMPATPERVWRALRG